VRWIYRVVVTLMSYGQAHDLLGFRLYKHVHSLFAFRSGAHIYLTCSYWRFVSRTYIHTWRAYMANRLDRERLEENLHVLQRLVPIYDYYHYIHCWGCPHLFLSVWVLVVGYTGWQGVLCKVNLILAVRPTRLSYSLDLQTAFVRLDFPYEG